MLADFQRKSPRNDVDFENPVSQGFRTPVISPPPRGQIPGGGEIPATPVHLKVISSTVITTIII